MESINKYMMAEGKCTKCVVKKVCRGKVLEMTIDGDVYRLRELMIRWEDKKERYVVTTESNCFYEKNEFTNRLVEAGKMIKRKGLEQMNDEERCRVLVLMQGASKRYRTLLVREAGRTEREIINVCLDSELGRECDIEHLYKHLDEKNGKIEMWMGRQGLTLNMLKEEKAAVKAINYFRKKQVNNTDVMRIGFKLKEWGEDRERVNCNIRPGVVKNRAFRKFMQEMVVKYREELEKEGYYQIAKNMAYN